jgi:hypothetical protein
MANTTSEMLWVQSLLNYLAINVPIPMLMYCDNQTAISIANNLVFHDILCLTVTLLEIY